MMAKSKAPKPPDPAQTAGAQTAQNIGTAIAQTSLNNVNQVTPDGTLTYSTTGATKWTDPNTGRVYDIPNITATQTLSQQQQAIKDQSDAAELNLATLGKDQSARLGSLLSAPVDLSNDAVEARIMELASARLNPQLDRRREQLTNTLSQQGIKLGSTAYDRAMEGNSQAENDAINQLLLTGRGQAVQEALTERNQPINEITALLSGSQVSQPNFVSTNPAQLANVDRAGLEQANYNAKLQAWQQKQAGIQSTIGGLFGLGGAAIYASDRRIKTDVRRIGVRGGLPLYAYRYLWDGLGTVRRGFMAQDVERVRPEAVIDGWAFKMLDYSMLPEVA